MVAADYKLLAQFVKSKHFVQTLSGEFVLKSVPHPTEEEDNLKFTCKCCNKQTTLRTREATTGKQTNNKNNKTDDNKKMYKQTNNMKNKRNNNKKI